MSIRVRTLLWLVRSRWLRRLAFGLLAHLFNRDQVAIDPSSSASSSMTTGHWSLLINALNVYTHIRFLFPILPCYLFLFCFAIIVEWDVCLVCLLSLSWILIWLSGLLFRYFILITVQLDRMNSQSRRRARRCTFKFDFMRRHSANQIVDSMIRLLKQFVTFLNIYSRFLLKKLSFVIFLSQCFFCFISRSNILLAIPDFFCWILV